MSWSRTVVGTRDKVVMDLAGLGEYLSVQDAEQNATEAQQMAHMAQARACHTAIKALHFSEPQMLEVSASGYANADGTGNVTLRIEHALIETPVPAEAATDEGNDDH